MLSLLFLCRHRELSPGKKRNPARAVGACASMNIAAAVGGLPTGAVAAGVVLVLLVLLMRSCMRPAEAGSREKHQHRSPLLGDVEGGASALAPCTLPPAVIEAASSGDTPTVASWLADERCVVDACSSLDGATALHAAARAGHVHLVRMLIEAGADSLAVDTGAEQWARWGTAEPRSNHTVWHTVSTSIFAPAPVRAGAEFAVAARAAPRRPPATGLVLTG